jgi:Aspartyl/Asparaginyl beta-hydroxylase
MTEPLAAWQYGFALDRLQALAAPFRSSTKRHVYGAFGLVKERDIAQALAEHRCRWWPDEGAPLIVALVRFLGRGSYATDFRGEKIIMPASAEVIEEVGYAEEVDDAALAGFLDAVRARPALFDSSPRFVEWFREDARLSRVIMGRLRGHVEATKIAAGSEIKAVARLGAEGADMGEAGICAFVEPQDALTLAVLQREVFSPAALAEVREELRAGAEFAQHYSSYNKARSWTALALRGYDPANPGDIVKPAEMCDWTVAAAQFPRTLTHLHQLTAALGSPALDRVRFMRLAPGGGELTRHADITDRSAGTRPGAVMRLHVPIETNPECRFTAWTHEGERLEAHLPAGALCYLDQRKPHTVVNRHAAEARTHLVIDAFANEALRALLAQPAAVPA